MKRVVLYVLIAILVLSLAAFVSCSDKADNKSPTVTQQGETEGKASAGEASEDKGSDTIEEENVGKNTDAESNGETENVGETEPSDSEDTSKIPESDTDGLSSGTEKNETENEKEEDDTSSDTEGTTAEKPEDTNEDTNEDTSDTDENNDWELGLLPIQ